MLADHEDCEPEETKQEALLTVDNIKRENENNETVREIRVNLPGGRCYQFSMDHSFMEETLGNTREESVTSFDHHQDLPVQTPEERPLLRHTPKESEVKCTGKTNS